MNQAKTLVRSWTFWFGIAQLLSAGLGFLSGNMDSNMALTLATTGLSTIGLRIKTTNPVSGIM